jgi:hypothetical protein
LAFSGHGRCYQGTNLWVEEVAGFYLVGFVDSWRVVVVFLSGERDTSEVVFHSRQFLNIIEQQSIQNKMNISFCKYIAVILTVV